jgi:hypothetical protein
MRMPLGSEPAPSFETPHTQIACAAPQDEAELSIVDSTLMVRSRAQYGVSNHEATPYSSKQT